MDNDAARVLHLLELSYSGDESNRKAGEPRDRDRAKEIQGENYSSEHWNYVAKKHRESSNRETKGILQIIIISTYLIILLTSQHQKNCWRFKTMRDTCS